MEEIIALVKQDELRLEALECVRLLDLPDCYIAAGFIRNLVWDHLHGMSSPTPLNDVDVIYFDNAEIDPELYLAYEQQLKVIMTSLNWQVRNQARMHERNGDPKYLNSVDAMSYWPEKETAVAIRKLENGCFECVSALGFESLFQCKVTYNPKRKREVFEKRVNSKGWLVHWPNLTSVL